MMSRLLLSIALFVMAPASVLAQAPKALPNPDLSKLTPAASAEVREARAAFEKAIVGQTGVSLAEMYGDIGAVYARVQMLDVTAVALDNAARAAPLDDRWAYLQGVVARARNQHPEARVAFERALKLNGMYLPSRMALAGELLHVNDLAEANKLLSVALADNENEPALRAVLGDIAFRQKRYAESVAYLTEAIRLDPQANALYGALARAQEAAGNAQAAREAQAKTGDVPPRLDDPVMQKLLPVISATPAPEPAADPKQLAIGEANFHAMAGHFDAARAALDQALKQHPNDAALLANYARIDAADGKFDAARTRVRAAVAADPKSIAAWTTQGLVLEMAKDDAGARDSYQKALAVEPKSVRVQLASAIGHAYGAAADAVKHTFGGDPAPNGAETGAFARAQFATVNAHRGTRGRR